MRRGLPATLLLCLVLVAPGAASARTGSFESGPSLHGAAGAYDHGSTVRTRRAVPIHSARARREAKDALRRVERLSDGRGVKTGFELTPAIKELLTRLPSLSGTDRRRANRLLARPTPNEGTAGDEEYQVPEHTPPFCSATFCVHWVDATEDAPPLDDADATGVPDYVETIARELENAHEVETAQLGWRTAPSDGTRGGNEKVDVYLQELAGSGIFGYASADPGQRSHSQAAFLVLDNDYSTEQYRNSASFIDPLRVTAAHEYNHVLQFGYDVLQDTWMFESTAVWMEDRVYDSINDYRQFLTPFAQLASVPMTRFNLTDGSDPLNLKVYGSGVWNTWIDEHYGHEVIRGAWERSLVTSPQSFAPAAYDGSLRAAGAGGFFNAFTRFAAELAEWRAGNGPLSEGPEFALDMQRASASTLRPDRDGLAGRLDHTAMAYLNVAPTTDARIKLVARSPRGTASAIALVGLDGPTVGGQQTVILERLPSGGPATVTLENPLRFERITAALINADTTQDGYSDQIGDWIFTKDNQEVAAHVSTDFKAPKLRRRTPRPKAKRVSRRGRVEVVFSEPVEGVSSRSVRLLGPNGRSIKARVSYSAKKRLATIVPRAVLKARTRYVVRLNTDVTDAGGNVAPAKVRSWSFTTGTR